MRILWAVSSVGKGHVMRDIAIVNQLQKIADVEVDWLAPDPAGGFLTDRGFRVLECSSRLAGSGKIYERIFDGCVGEYNLMNYVRADTRLHWHDFKVSAQCWKSRAYDAVVGDEAFWLLTGFCFNPLAKPAPFVFMTDFIGTRVMRPRPRDILTAWYVNSKFALSFLGPDMCIYIGSAGEIPDERFGFLLPGRRKWAQRHYRFIKPVVSFDPGSFPDKKTVRERLGLDSDKVFLAAVGPEGGHVYRRGRMEEVFELLKADYPRARFILVGPERGMRGWIEYHTYLDKLYEYFAASDCVLIQSGYGKVSELSALGIPFIAIPLDYHFEQEYYMDHRLDYYGVGRLMTLRDHSPQDMAQAAHETMGMRVGKISADTGSEAAGLILEACRKRTGA